MANIHLVTLKIYHIKLEKANIYFENMFEKSIDNRIAVRYYIGIPNECS